MPRKRSPSDEGRKRRGYFNWEKSRAGYLLLDWLEDPANSSRWKAAALACKDGELRGTGPTKNALVNEILKFLKINGETGLTTKQVKNKMFNYERSYWVARKLRKRPAPYEEEEDGQDDGKRKRSKDEYAVCGEFDRLHAIFDDGSTIGLSGTDSDGYMEGSSVFSDAEGEESPEQPHELSNSVDDCGEATTESNGQFSQEGHSPEETGVETLIPEILPCDHNESASSHPRKTSRSRETGRMVSPEKRKSRVLPAKMAGTDVRLSERRLELEHIQRMKELEVREKEADNQNLLLRYLIGQSNLGLPR